MLDKERLLAILQERSQWRTRKPVADAGFVYAIQAGESGLVKLGFSHDVPQRLQQMQTSHTEPLRILWYQLGTREDETLIHSEFAAYRRIGEWFDLQGSYVVDELNRLVPPRYAKGIIGEWIARGIASDTELEQLMDTLHIDVFDLSIREHAKLKDLRPYDSLPDSETLMELAIDNLGTAVAWRFHIIRDSQGFNQLKRDCHEAGKVAGNARREIEQRTRKPVVSAENYKQLHQERQQERQRELQPGLFDQSEDQPAALHGEELARMFRVEE